jgi:hypothetical protein
MAKFNVVVDGRMINIEADDFTTTTVNDTLMRDNVPVLTFYKNVPASNGGRQVIAVYRKWDSVTLAIAVYRKWDSVTLA